MKGFLTLCSLFALSAGVVSAAGGTEEARDTLDRAVVTAQKSPLAFTGLKRLDAGDLLEGVAVLGTPDVVKVLQNLPGVASGMELVSGLYVHGGDGSDNLFLLDGVPLFQVSHLGGLFSSFNTDVIRSIDFYKSGFPARYGGKLSSVVDVTTRDGSMEEFGGSVSVGLIDGRVNLNGPIVRNKLSYDIAVRRSWLDAIYAPLFAIKNSRSDETEKGAYVLFDTNVNLTYTPTPSDKLNLRFFMGADSFRYNRARQDKYYGQEIYYADSGTTLNIDWGNLAVSSGWNHTFSERARLSAIAYYSRGYSDIYDWQKSNVFDNEVLVTSTHMESSASSVNAAGIKSNYLVCLGRHRLSAGLEWQSSWYDPSRSLEKTQDGAVQAFESGSGYYSANEVSAFVEDEMVYGAFGLTAGIRLDGYFTDAASYFRPQPRVSASYEIGDEVILKASYEMMSQYSHLLSSMYLDLPTNLWMPSTRIIRPSDSHQLAAGTYVRFSKNWHMDLGGYYRTIENCLMYSGADSFFPPIDRWEGEFVSGRGRSYGAEVELKYISGKVRAAAYYTLSWSERNFEQLHHTWFRDRFDNRHKLTLTGTWQITENIDLNATWNYHSGNRVTVPEHVVDLPYEFSRFLFSEPYNAQLPDYHRLDLSCNFRKKTKRGNESIWNISIYNAYCRMNPIMMRYTRNPEGSPVALVYSIVPIIPSFNYTFKF